MDENTRVILEELKKLNARMDAMESGMNARMDAMETRISDMHNEMIEMHDEVTDMFAEMTKATSDIVNESEQRIMKRIDGIEAKLDDNRQITKQNCVDIARLRSVQ